MIDANLFFETLNWAWTFALAFMVMFMFHYLWEKFNEIGWRTFLFDRPTAEQFAIAICVADLGAWMVRGATAIWRTVGADLTTLNGLTAYVLIIGAVIGTIGILCKLRVVSKFRFGNWPWYLCSVCIALLIVYQYVIRGMVYG